jgi:hypothetical protein
MLLLLAVGAAPVAQGNGLADPPAPATPTTTVAPPTARATGTEPRTIDFAIQDALGDGQVTEQIKVQVDDRLVGTLTVDVAHRQASLTVTVLKAGSHSYTLASLTTFEFDDGSVGEIAGYGHGQIDVGAGKVFKVRYDVGDEQLDLALE